MTNADCPEGEFCSNDNGFRTCQFGDGCTSTFQVEKREWKWGDAIEDGW